MRHICVVKLIYHVWDRSNDSKPEITAKKPLYHDGENDDGDGDGASNMHVVLG